MVIYPEDENNPAKAGIILDGSEVTQVNSLKAPTPQEKPMAYQLVGGVKAHQGNDE